MSQLFFGRRSRSLRGFVLIAMLAVWAFGTPPARAEIIFSNYGPGMSYNPTAWTVGPFEGGALLSYNGPLTGLNENRVMMSAAAFMTGDHDVLPTKVTLAIDTWHDVDLYILPDDGGKPGPLLGDLYHMAQSLPSPIDNNLHGFGHVSGNVEVPMTPGIEWDADMMFTIPRPMKANTRYWLLICQHDQQFGIWGDGDPRSYTFWYRSVNDPAVSSPSVYVRDLPAFGGLEGGFVPGVRPAFQIEGTLVVPEPASVSLILLIGGGLLLARRRRRGGVVAA